MSPLEPAASEAVDALDIPPAAALVGVPLARDFTAEDLPALRRTVQDSARALGLTGETLDDVVLAIHELATNAVRHGGGRGRVELRRDGDTLVCDVIDHGPGFTGGVPVTGSPPSPRTPGGRGLWLARNLTDTLLVTDGPAGVTVSITVCIPAAAPADVLLTAPMAALDTLPAELSPHLRVPPATPRLLAPPVTAAEPDTPDPGPATTGSVDR